MIRSCTVSYDQLTKDLWLAKPLTSVLSIFSDSPPGSHFLMLITLLWSPIALSKCPPTLFVTLMTSTSHRERVNKEISYRFTFVQV